MAHVKVIWGPHKTTIESDRVKWSFTGVYANGEFARWTLRFFLDSRRFTTRAGPQMPSDPDPTQLLLLPAMAAAENKTGRVTPMLRALLKPEHLAEAMRLAIEWQRKQP